MADLLCSTNRKLQADTELLQQKTEFYEHSNGSNYQNETKVLQQQHEKINDPDWWYKKADVTLTLCITRQQKWTRQL